MHFCLLLKISKKYIYIVKKIRKSLSCTYNRKLLDHAKQSTEDTLKTVLIKNNSKKQLK